MAMLLVALAFVFGIALVLGGYTLIAKLPRLMQQRTLERRLQELSATPEQEARATEAKGLVKVMHDGAVPSFDRLMATTTRGSALGRWIDQSGVKASLSGVFLVAAALAVAIGLVVGLFAGFTLGFPLGCAAGFNLPFMFLKMKRTRRMRTFEEQFPDGLDLIARALKAGHAFATGLKMVADEMPEPVGPEFRKTFDEQNFGLPLKDALDNLTLRVPHLDVRFFATAVLIQRETGGNLAEILENLAHVVRERFKILRQVRVHTAHGRFTGYVLLGLPAVMLVGLTFINPEHMGLLFTERMGQMMLGAALVLQTIGYLWIKQVIKIEV
jgi:tight adherence protein B